MSCEKKNLQDAAKTILRDKYTGPNNFNISF